jgi:hypothetical protein
MGRLAGISTGFHGTSGSALGPQEHSSSFQACTSARSGYVPRCGLICVACSTATSPSPPLDGLSRSCSLALALALSLALSLSRSLSRSRSRSLSLSLSLSLARSLALLLSLLLSLRILLMHGLIDRLCGTWHLQARPPPLDVLHTVPAVSSVHFWINVGMALWGWSVLRSMVRNIGWWPFCTYTIWHWTLLTVSWYLYSLPDLSAVAAGGET